MHWDSPGLVAGVDEAGRGPLAGPVMAAAVILDERNPIPGLADSKKLSARQRERLFDEIRAKALCCAIAQASAIPLASQEKRFRGVIFDCCFFSTLVLFK